MTSSLPGASCGASPILGECFRKAIHSQQEAPSANLQEIRSFVGVVLLGLHWDFPVCHCFRVEVSQWSNHNEQGINLA